MAEFGPKVFHALGMYADKDRQNGFETASPSDVGLTEGATSECDIIKQIEKVKNALFKVMMFRLRNLTNALGCEGTKKHIGSGKGGIPVSMTVYFNNTAIHKEDKDTSDENVRNSLSAQAVFNVQGPFIVPDLLLDSQDITDSLIKLNSLMMACGSYTDLNKALEKTRDKTGKAIDDPVYAALWPKKGCDEKCDND